MPRHAGTGRAEVAVRRQRTTTTRRCPRRGGATVVTLAVALLVVVLPGTALANSPPTFTSPDVAAVPESTTAVMTLAATDPDLDTVTFSVTGGADSTRFDTTGANGESLVFVSPPDFEAPIDVGGTPGDNVYEVEVTADDGNLGQTAQMVTVTVTDVNEPPTVDDAAFSVSARPAPGAKVGRVTATDPDAGDAVASFAIVSGDPRGALAVSSTGAISVAEPATLAEDAPFSLTVRGFDGAGLSGDATVTVSLNPNQPPVIVDPGSTQREGEGELVVLDPIKFTDADSGDRHEAVVDWGDGIVEAATVDAIAGEVRASHVYADNATYPVTVTVSDLDGATAVAAVTLRIRNEQPVVDVADPVTAEEGTAVDLPTLAFTDPGTLDTHLADVRWRDGSPSDAVTVLEAPFGPPGSTAGLTGFLDPPPHAYPDDGTYVARICVSDDEGSRGCRGVEVTVLNADPVVTAPPAVVGTPEGSAVQLAAAAVTDPGVRDRHTATVAWGDGSPPEAVPVGDGFLTPPPHVYADDGSYAVEFCAADGDGGEGCDTVVVPIDNVAPVFETLSVTDVDGNPTLVFAEGEVAVFTGTFADPGDDVHTIVVEWGDGAETSIEVGRGSRRFEGEHVYASGSPPGQPFFARVTVFDDDGGAAAVGGPITVLTAVRAGVGLFDPGTGTWHLRDPDGSIESFRFGDVGDVPVAGDWDCDGISTPGVYRPSERMVYLTDTNASGAASRRFRIGQSGDVPIAGDFDGDGCDTLGVYSPGLARFVLYDELGPDGGEVGDPAADFVFGDLGDKPFAGDFDGDGIDEVGLHRETTGLVYFRLTNTTGNADRQFVFGDPGDRLVAGDWTGAGFDSPGLFRPANSTFFLRFSNTQGNADEVFAFGDASFLPVAGAWSG